MIRRHLMLPLACSALTACAHGGLMPNQSHRETAPKAFEYALFANNAYAREDTWIDLPQDTSLVVECPNDEIGLAFSIFRKQQSSKNEYIFAFRGTEDFGEEGKKDWRYGNLSFEQQKRSEPIVRRFVEKHPYDDIVFVGHSLGGALALHNSMRFPGRRVYVFNTSPRFYAPPEYDPASDTSLRSSIVEPGEALGVVRIFFKDLSPVRFNCLSKGGPVFQHSILRLGVCLTRIAASEAVSVTDIAARARQYLDLNPWAIEAATHPLTTRKPTALCVR